MGKRGPAPRSKKLKLIKRDKKNRITDQPKAQRPLGRMRAPSHLTRGAQREWRKMVKVLDEMQILGACDHAILGAYCTVYDYWVRATEPKAKLGYQKHMIELAKELGLSHQARSRMRLDPPKPKGGMAKYIR